MSQEDPFRNTIGNLGREKSPEGNKSGFSLEDVIASLTDDEYVSLVPPLMELDRNKNKKAVLDRALDLAGYNWKEFKHIEPSKIPDLCKLLSAFLSPDTEKQDLEQKAKEIVESI